MIPALTFVAVPILFFMLTWVVVTALRICLPEEPRPIREDLYLFRHTPEARRRRIPIGVKEIYEDQRRHQKENVPIPYEYFWGDSGGFPDAWAEDLWLRRN